jgi:hypothetical protein
MKGADSLLPSVSTEIMYEPAAMFSADKFHSD